MTDQIMRMSFNIDRIRDLEKMLPYRHQCKCGEVRLVTGLRETFSCGKCGEGYFVTKEE